MSARRPPAASWPRFGAAAVLCLCAALGAGPAAADFLRLDTGESFTGTLVNVKSGLLRFKTSLSGQVMAPMDTVSALESGRPFVITLGGGETLYGRFAREDGRPVLRKADGSAQPITLAEIDEALEVPGGAGDGWEAEVSLNLQARTGIRDSVEPSARLELRGPLGSGGEASIEAEADRADPERFPAQARLRAERFPAEGRGAFLSLDAERAADRALSWRTGVTLGAGRWLSAWGGREWLATVGIQPSYESWSLAAAGAGAAHGEDASASAGRLNLHLGARFGWQAGDRLEIGQRFTLLPDLLAPGDFRAISETELNRAVTDNLRLRLHVLFEYTTDPLLAPADPWNASLGAGIAFEF